MKNRNHTFHSPNRRPSRWGGIWEFDKLACRIWKSFPQKTVVLLICYRIWLSQNILVFFMFTFVFVICRILRSGFLAFTTSTEVPWAGKKSRNHWQWWCQVLLKCTLPSDFYVDHMWPLYLFVRFVKRQFCINILGAVACWYCWYMPAYIGWI